MSVEDCLGEFIPVHDLLREGRLFLAGRVHVDSEALALGNGYEELVVWLRALVRLLACLAVLLEPFQREGTDLFRAIADEDDEDAWVLGFELGERVEVRLGEGEDVLLNAFVALVAYLR